MSISGDRETNRYTDAVVSDIKERLDVDFAYGIFGGSSYADYFEEVKKKDVRLPIIRIDTVANFTFDCNECMIKRPDGYVDVIKCDFVDMLPYCYGVKLSIRYDKASEEKACVIESKLRAAYAEETELWVEIPSFRGNSSMIKLCAAPQQTPSAPEVKGGVSIKTIPFNQYHSVYYFGGWDAETLNIDPRQQYAVLQIAEFSISTHKKLHAARYWMGDSYKSFITHQRISFLEKLVLSSSFVELKNRYDKGLPIEKPLFDKAFKYIVGVFPQLFNFFKIGLSYDEIVSIIQERADELQTRYNDACSALDLPESIKGDYDTVLNCREPKSLAHLAELMSKNNKPLSEALKQYVIELEKEERQRLMEIGRLGPYEKERIERIIREQMSKSDSGLASLEVISKEEGEAELGINLGNAPADYNSYDDYNNNSTGYSASERGNEGTATSNGSGFIRQTIATAAGVYIGERLAERKRAKEASKMPRRHYTCSLSCPNRIENHGVYKCKFGWKPDNCNGKSIYY